jgi:hypothetical protein
MWSIAVQRSNGLGMRVDCYFESDNCGGGICRRLCFRPFTKLRNGGIFDRHPKEFLVECAVGACIDIALRAKELSE